MTNEQKYNEKFKNFLSSEEVYKDNQQYWKSIIRKITNNDYKDWVINSFANGNEIKDGNPLFACSFGNNKALRIIQEKRNSFSPIFASWTSNYQFDDDETEIDELVIALQPYKETYTYTSQLINAFLQNKYKNFQKKLNVEFNKKTNLKRVQHILNFLENSELQNYYDKINKNHLDKEQINYNLFKKINLFNENLIFYQSIFDDKVLKKSYISVLKNIEDLNKVITIKDSYNLTERFRSTEYKKEIIKNYSNMHNYWKSYNSKVEKLNKNYQDLKYRFKEIM